MTKSFQHWVNNTIVQLLLSFRHSVLYVSGKPAPDVVCSSFYAIIKCTPSVNIVGKLYRGSTVLPEPSRSSLHLFPSSPLRTRIPSTQSTFLATSGLLLSLRTCFFVSSSRVLFSSRFYPTALCFQRLISDQVLRVSKRNNCVNIAFITFHSLSLVSLLCQFLIVIFISSSCQCTLLLQCNFGKLYYFVIN